MAAATRTESADPTGAADPPGAPGAPGAEGPVGPTAPPAPPGRSRDRVPPLVLGVRLLLVAAAGVLVGTGAPTVARTVLTVLAAGAALAGPLHRRDSRAGDRVLVGTGALLLVPLALGLALDLLPGGLTRSSWGWAVAAAELVAVVATPRWRPLRDARPALPAGRTVLTGACALAAAGVVALALVVSTRATNSDEAAPLQMQVTGDPPCPPACPTGPST